MALSAREFVESFAALLVMFLDATFTSFPKEELIKLTPIKAITAHKVSLNFIQTIPSLNLFAGMNHLFEIDNRIIHLPNFSIKLCG